MRPFKIFTLPLKSQLKPQNERTFRRVMMKAQAAGEEGLLRPQERGLTWEGSLFLRAATPTVNEQKLGNNREQADRKEGQEQTGQG